VDLQSVRVLYSAKPVTRTRAADSPSEREPAADLSQPLIEALARAMAARDEATHEHAQRVQQYAAALAREAGISDAPMLHAIDVAALLHDIGKLGIPDRVLHKPGPLEQDEYNLVKQHVTIGADILSALCPGPLALLVRHHHENWDGTGYPDGLRGADIPIGARVLSIVDCYDALTSDRPYRGALSHACALAMIGERRGSMYDPDIVDSFVRIIQRVASAPAAERAVRPQVEPPWREARAV
jgi:putative nucleotidyltransferase with HDIG domain